MNQQQFDTLFTALYFALSTHCKKSGIVVRKGRPFYTDGYAAIELEHGYSLNLELADLAAYRDASALKKKTLLDGLVGQARSALSGRGDQTEVTSQESLPENER